MTLVGPASWEVPVSTATWQSAQRPCFLLLMAMSSICTCQYPVCRDTGCQNMSEAMCSVLMSPKVISELSMSESERKTEKRGRFNASLLTNLSMMLNSGPCDIFGNASPKTPSKLKEVKGSSVSSVAPTKRTLVQRLPMQTSSCRKTPLISPVPKVMVTTSRSPPRSTALSGWSAKATSIALWEPEASKRLCVVHASSLQAFEGSSRFPLPVSKTTRNSCGGFPTVTLP
mmetsp:Transcript_48160/g.148760  ORF Transcript_48160/g.148760 Transcript_48160/m.148760 type:complete len:229 (+) Transcript_48160:143-829(+)